MKVTLPSLVVFVITVLAASLSFAAGEQAAQPPGGMQAPRHGPPKEAVDVCAGKQSGATCSFTAPRGTISGICRMVPEGKMACVPAKGMEPPNGQPGGSRR